MENSPRNGIVLTLDECKALFPRLKGLENVLLAPEREILLRMEKVLYEHLSVQEAEILFHSFPG
jgi:hypothetical protein